MVQVGDTLVDLFLREEDLGGIGNKLGTSIHDEKFRGPKFTNNFITNELVDVVANILQTY